MKMTWALVFGGLVMLWGATILLKAFGVDLPLFQTAFAIFLIVAGVRILSHAWFPNRAGVIASGRSAVMTDATFQPDSYRGEPLKYDVVFSKGLVDLTKLPAPDRDVRVEVNSVFGGCEIRVDPTIPYEVEGSAAFGAVRIPHKQTAAFGTVRTESPAYGPRLRIKATAVFGECNIQEVTAARPVKPLTQEPLPSH